MIKTWKERVDANQFENFFSRQDAMQAEIDELRAALETAQEAVVNNCARVLERDAEIERLKRSVEETASGPLSEEAYDIAQSKIADQRKILEQALEALQRNVQHKYPLEPKEAVNLGQAAITAIQGVLK